MVDVLEKKELIDRKTISEFFDIVESEVKFLMSRWGYKNLDDYVKDVSTKQKTQTKTKLIGVFYESFFKRILIKNGYNIISSDDKGFDIIIDGIKYEIKLTLSNDDSWTGNSFSKVKVSKTILIKLKFDVNDNIEECFFGILDMENSKWVGDTKKGNSGFSTLHILTEDFNNLNVIYGSVKSNKKYLGIIREKYGN